MKCVAPQTSQPRQSDNACEERSVERYAMLLEKAKHKITMRRRFTCLTSNCACRHTALIVLSSLLRRETHFLDDDLARINSTTAQTSCSIHVPPRILAGSAFFLVFSHFVHALSHCSQRSCKRCVVDNSLGWAQVIGTSSIAKAMKQDTSRDCRRVGKSSMGM